MEDEEHSNIWEEYKSDTKPLKARHKHTPVPERPITIGRAEFIWPRTDHDALLTIDKPTWHKIKSKKILIDATIDLHGYFLEEAFNMLNDFLKNHYSRGHRVLLVITGKSSFIQNKPTIRSSLKDWIENTELLNIVHSISDAADIHGGKGAVYLKLRKKT